MANSGRESEYPAQASTEHSTVESSLDVVFTVLSERHCRYVLYYFVQSEVDLASTDELEEAVRMIDAQTSQENKNTTGGYDLTETLVEESLPYLERTGAVEYDSRSESVRYCGEPRLEEYAAHAAYQELGSAGFRSNSR
jgi:hypothetical protein